MTHGPLYGYSSCCHMAYVSSQGARVGAAAPIGTPRGPAKKAKTQQPLPSPLMTHTWGGAILLAPFPEKKPSSSELGRFQQKGGKNRGGNRQPAKDSSSELEPKWPAPSTDLRNTAAVQNTTIWP